VLSGVRAGLTTPHCITLPRYKLLRRTRIHAKSGGGGGGGGGGGVVVAHVEILEYGH